jgi:hypothetical protein
MNWGNATEHERTRRTLLSEERKFLFSLIGNFVVRKAEAEVSFICTWGPFERLVP